MRNYCKRRSLGLALIPFFILASLGVVVFEIMRNVAGSSRETLLTRVTVNTQTQLSNLDVYRPVAFSAGRDAIQARRSTYRLFELSDSICGSVVAVNISNVEAATEQLRYTSGLATATFRPSPTNETRYFFEAVSNPTVERFVGLELTEPSRIHAIRDLATQPVTSTGISVAINNPDLLTTVVYYEYMPGNFAFCLIRLELQVIADTFALDVTDHENVTTRLGSCARKGPIATSSAHVLGNIWVVDVWLCDDVDKTFRYIILGAFIMLGIISGIVTVLLRHLVEIRNASTMDRMLVTYMRRHLSNVFQHASHELRQPLHLMFSSVTISGSSLEISDCLEIMANPDADVQMKFDALRDIALNSMSTIDSVIERFETLQVMVNGASERLYSVYLPSFSSKLWRFWAFTALSDSPVNLHVAKNIDSRIHFPLNLFFRLGSIGVHNAASHGSSYMNISVHIFTHSDHVFMRVENYVPDISVDDSRETVQQFRNICRMNVNHSRHKYSPIVPVRGIPGFSTKTGSGLGLYTAYLTACTMDLPLYLDVVKGPDEQYRFIYMFGVPMTRIHGGVYDDLHYDVVLLTHDMLLARRVQTALNDYRVTVVESMEEVPPGCVFVLDMASGVTPMQVRSSMATPAFKIYLMDMVHSPYTQTIDTYALPRKFHPSQLSSCLTLIRSVWDVQALRSTP